MTTPIGSDPAWPIAYVPTADEWNLWWAKKLDVTDTVVANGPFMPVAGGTMIGTLTLNGPPVLPLDAATKAYVDAITPAAGPFMPLSGGNFTGNVNFGTGARLSLAQDPLVPMEAVTKQYADVIAVNANTAQVTANNAVKKAGDTMTGMLILAGDPSNAFGATTKQYVDRFLPLAGGTMTGSLITSSVADITCGRNLYVNNGMFILDPVGYEWQFYCNTNGDKIQAFRTNWYDLWSGSTGTRTWVGPSGNLMTLDPNGNLTLRQGLTAPGTINLGVTSVTQLKLTGTWSLAPSGTNLVQNYSAGWYDYFDLTNGYRHWIGSSGGLMLLDAGGNLTTTGNMVCNELIAANGVFAQSDASLGFWNAGSGFKYFQFSPGWYWGWQTGDGSLDWYANGNLAYQFRASDNSFIVFIGNGFKPGGGSWAATSDARVKTVSGNYTPGLAEILQLQPVRYHYNGNDGVHIDDSVLAKEFIGMVAQAVETVIPAAVSQTDGMINGATVHDMRVLDMTPIWFAVLNAVKELASRVSALEGAA